MRNVLLVAVIVGMVPAVSLARGEAKARYTEVAADDPGSGLAADQAVHEQGSKLKNGLKLGEVVKAERLNTGKMAGKFRLCLKVLGGEDGTTASFAQAEVSVDEYSNYKLLRWTAKKRCPK